MKGARLLMWVALGIALGYLGTSAAFGQTLTTPLPPGCVVTLNQNGPDFFISCTAAPPTGPVLSATPSTLTFPSTSVGTAAPVQTVTVRNTGSGTITLGAPGKDGANPGDFTRSGSCSNGTTLSGDKTCVSNWTFVPGSTGARSASATQQSSAGPFTTALSGTGASNVPPEPPSVSCGDLQVVEGGSFSFSSQQVWDIRLGRGDEQVYILKTTIAAADAGKKSHINIVEHGSGAHYKTIWASKTKCLMDGTTMESSNSSPSVYVSVNGTDNVNMAVGETWYFMFRNLSSSGKNTCSDNGGCGERITAYGWVNGATAFQRGGPLPLRDRVKTKAKAAVTRK
jgi:hypothetical protein